MNQLPPMKLPSLFQKKEPDEDWSRLMMLYSKEDYNPMVFHHDSQYYKMSTTTTTTTTDILLPPILTNPTQQITNSPVPLSPPYSTCSSALSVSSSPSSPSSSSGISFSSYSSVTTTTKKKGSIQSLLNSCSELLELEKQHYFKQDDRKSNKRSLDEIDDFTNCNNKIQKIGDHRQIKGLRLFSKQVYDKVAEKKITTYNEVADELAADIQRNHQQNNIRGIDQKNIRRRVYDALNVFMALNLISKNRKEIKWLGFDQHERTEAFLEREIQFEEARQKMLLNSIKSDQIMCDNAWLDLNRLNQLVRRNQQQEAVQPEHSFQFPFFAIHGQDMEIKYHHANEACISSSSSSMIYNDVDILTKIWPSSTIVS